MLLLAGNVGVRRWWEVGGGSSAGSSKGQDVAQWEPVLVLGPNPVLILSFYTHGRRQTAVDGDYDRHDEGITTFVL